MSLRAKIVLSLVALSTAATLAIGVFAYRTTAEQMGDQIDRSEMTASNLAGSRALRAMGAQEAGRRDLVADSDTMFQLLDRQGDRFGTIDESSPSAPSTGPSPGRASPGR